MGLLKLLNGYIYIMDGQKSCVRSLRNISRCQRKVVSLLISKGMYRPVMRGEREIKELEKGSLERVTCGV